MARIDNAVARQGARSIEMNKVLKNTYTLLAMTLLFSGATAGMAMVMNFPRLGGSAVVIGPSWAALSLQAPWPAMFSSWRETSGPRGMRFASVRQRKYSVLEEK